MSFLNVSMARGQSSCPGGPPGAAGFRIAKASAGLALQDATQDQHAISAQFIPLYNWNVGTVEAPACGWGYQRLRIDSATSYDDKRTAGGALNVTRNHRIFAQHMIFLTSNALFAYVSGDLTHNSSLGVRFSQAYAGGFGYARNAYEVGADVRVIRENLYGIAEKANLVGIGLSGRYEFPLDVMLAGATITLTDVAVPVINQADAWMNNAAVDMTLPFTTKKSTWGVSLILEENYLRNAPPKFKRNYFRTSVNLAYSSK